MKTKIQPYLLTNVNGVGIEIKISFSDVEQIKYYAEFTGFSRIRENRFIETYFDNANKRTIIIAFRVEITE